MKIPRSLPAADLPSANAATATYSAQDILVVYDNLGNEVTLDVYYTKVTDTPPTTDWEVTVYNAADRGIRPRRFPYGAANFGTQTMTLTHDRQRPAQ
jgi:flagellar hook protein FlgE